MLKVILALCTGIDTIDNVHGIGNTPTHSIENGLFQCGVFLSWSSLGRSRALLS
jgi:hypothetical protein